MDTLEKPINLQIGARLHMARKLKGLSQAQLGGGIAVSFQQIQKYERGTNAISAAKLQRFADILGVTVNYFYDAPDVAAPDFPPPRRKFLHLIQALQRLEQQRPAAFLAVCNLAAALAPKHFNPLN